MWGTENGALIFCDIVTHLQVLSRPALVDPLENEDDLSFTQPSIDKEEKCEKGPSDKSWAGLRTCWCLV